jgi:hypothetical protein
MFRRLRCSRGLQLLCTKTTRMTIDWFSAGIILPTDIIAQENDFATICLRATHYLKRQGSSIVASVAT